MRCSCRALASPAKTRITLWGQENSLERELLYGREVVLFAPHFAIVFSGHLEQFQMAICGRSPTLIAQPLHFGSVKRLEVNRDPEILIEDLHAIDATNGGCHG